MVSGLLGVQSQAVARVNGRLRSAEFPRACMVAESRRRPQLLKKTDHIESGSPRSAIPLRQTARSIFDDADLSYAEIGFTTFANLDLGTVKGLDTVVSDWPSSIGIDTIYMSRGRIPKAFLRCMGVPNELIKYLTSTRKPLLLHSCFISHSSKDERFCDQLRIDLQSKKVANWYFPENARWGEPVWSEIDRSIKLYDKLVVVCSKNSLQSGPVLREIERALNREDCERKNILFPITLDNYIFDEWEHPRRVDVLAKVVGDFRGWSRSAEKYNAAFKKLLKALKAEDVMESKL